MALYGITMTLTYVAWDTANQAGKTGDVGNHTLRWVKNGTSAAPSNSPAEVDATNAPGVYKVALTAAECETPIGTLAGKSSTADIVLIPLTVTFERIPNVAPGDNGGLPTVDGDNFVEGIQGTKNTLDDLNDIDGTGLTVDLAADQSGVTIGTVTENTDMVGTDGANTTAPDNTTIGENATALTAIGAALVTLASDLAALQAIVDDLTEDDAGTSRFTENALEEAPTGSGGAGSGDTEVTLTVEDADEDPVADAAVTVRASSDYADDVVASGVTDNFGALTVWLDAGTYYRWAVKSGVNFTNPQTFVVT